MADAWSIGEIEADQLHGTARSPFLNLQDFHLWVQLKRIL